MLALGSVAQEGVIGSRIFNEVGRETGGRWHTCAAARAHSFDRSEEENGPCIFTGISTTYNVPYYLRQYTCNFRGEALVPIDLGAQSLLFSNFAKLGQFEPSENLSQSLDLSQPRNFGV